MSIDLQLPEKKALHPVITIFGVGGGGCNAVANMITSGLEGVNFVAANTDAQALALLPDDVCRKIVLGPQSTEGLGAGGRPDVGRQAAEESIEEIENIFDEGTHMLFVVTSLGGGSGTGASPVVSRIAKERGVLTVAVATKPFEFEGTMRMRIAEEGVLELRKWSDTILVIPNQNLCRNSSESTTFRDAFAMADKVLYQGVSGITDLMVKPGLVNLDFADIRSVINHMGKAKMGVGEATGENRAREAAESAISSPLLEDVSMQGARGLLLNVSGSDDMTLFEVESVVNRIREEVDQDALILFGAAMDASLDGTLRVSVVATGIDADMEKQQLSGKSSAEQDAASMISRGAVGQIPQKKGWFSRLFSSNKKFSQEETHMGHQQHLYRQESLHQESLRQRIPNAPQRHGGGHASSYEGRDAGAFSGQQEQQMPSNVMPLRRSRGDGIRLPSNAQTPTFLRSSK